MKKVLLFLFIFFAFTACKKDNNDPQPTEPVETPADKVAGNYKMSSFHLILGADELEMPALPILEGGKTVASGTVKITRKSASKILLSASLFVEGEGTEDVLKDREIEVREVGSNFGLYYSGERIGDADGGFLIFNISGTDPDTGEEVKLAFNAKK